MSPTSSFERERQREIFLQLGRRLKRNLHEAGGGRAEGQREVTLRLLEGGCDQVARFVSL